MTVATPTPAPVTAPVVHEPTTPIRASEAIRLGCLLFPRQITGRRFDEFDGACATGAMFAGGGLGDEPVIHLHWQRWPGLMDDRGHPAASESCSLLESGKETVTSFLVEHLNDTHGWTREHIADWLESIGL